MTQCSLGRLAEYGLRGVVLLGVVIAVVLAPEARAQEAAHSESQEHAAEAEHEAQSSGGHHEPMGRHRVVLFMGNTLIPKSSAGESTDILVPTFGVDYSYWVSPKFGFGVGADFEISSYVVETGDSGGHRSASGGEGEGEVRRQNALILAGLLFWEPIHRVMFFGGAGREFEQHEDFWVIRLGAEYAFPLPDQWGLGVTLMYDHKEVYDTWSFGVGFTKRFGKPLN